jgi:translocation and assembly module TamB
LFIIGLVLTGLVLALRSEWTGEQVCRQLREHLPRSPGVEITIGQCRLEPLDLGVELSGLRVVLPGPTPTAEARLEEMGAEAGGLFERDRTVHVKPPLIRDGAQLARVGADGAEVEPRIVAEADRAEVRLNTIPFLFGTARVDRIEVDHPRINADLRFIADSPSTESKKSEQCEVNELLKKVEVSRLVVDEGSATVLLPGGRVLNLDELSVSARSSHRVNTLRVSQEGGSIRFDGGKLPLDKLLVSAQLDAATSSLEVSRLELLGGQLSVLGHGSVHDLCDPDLSIEANVGAPLDLLIGLANPPGLTGQGYVTANVSVNGKIDAPAAHAEVDLSDLALVVQGQHLDPRDLSASIDLHDDKINLTQLYWPLGDGYGKISAEITRTGDWPITVWAEGKNVPFGELMNRLPLKHPWVDAQCGVKAKLTGHLLPLPQLGGPAVADFNDFHVRTRAWDKPPLPDDEVLGLKHARVETDFNFTPERVRLTHAHITTEHTEAFADATLYTDTERGLDIKGELKAVDISEFGPIVGMPWAGVGTAEAHITGPYGRQTIDGTASLKDFTFFIVHPGDVTGTLHFDPSFVLQFKDVVAQKGKSVIHGHGQLDFSNGAPLGGGGVSVADARIEDLLDVLYEVHWGFALFRGQMTGLASGNINLQKGPILAPTSDIDLSLRDLAVWQRPMGAGHFHMHTQDGDSLTVDPMTLDGALGQITFGGWQRVGGDVHYSVEMKDISVPLATAPELTDWNMTGTLSGQATLSGPQQQIQINGEVFGSELTMFDVPVGEGHVTIKGTGTSMSINGPVGDDVDMQMRMRWEDLLPMTAHFNFNVTDLFKYVPTSSQWNDVSGQVKGTLDVTGQMKDPSRYVMHYIFPTVIFTKGDYTEENSGPVIVDYAHDTYAFRKLSFKGHRENEKVTDTDFTILGTRTGDEEKLNLEVSGTLDARLFETLVPWVENSSGRVGVHAAITGTQSKPQVVGNLDLSTGKLKLRDYPIQLDDLKGRVEFSQAAVQVLVDGRMNRGRANLSGNISLTNFRPSSYDLRLDMDEAQLRLPDFPPMTLSGELFYNGLADDPVVSGSVTVDRFHYNVDYTTSSLIADLSRQKLEAKLYTKSPHWVSYRELSIHMGSDVWVDDNLAKVQLQGQVSLIGDNSRPILQGSISSVEGGRVNYLNNVFLVDQATVDFHDTERITPDFDLHAHTEVRNYQVFLHAFGTPDDFVTTDSKASDRLQFSSNPPLPKSDIPLLLTVGYTPQDRGTMANAALTSAIDIGVDALSEATGLSDQLKRFMPKDNTILKDPSAHLTTMYSQRLGQNEPTAELEGKIFSDRFRLRLQYPVVGNSQNFGKAQAEFKMTDNSSAQLQVDGDNVDYTFPDVGLDLKLRWEVK